MTIKRIGIALGVLLVLALLAFVGVVRFGGLVIRDKQSRKVIFGYDSEAGSFLINEYKKVELKGYDGPYLSRVVENGIYSVVVDDSKGHFDIFTNTFAASDSVFECRVDNEDRDRFSFVVQKNVQPQPGSYDSPDRIIALSDIEGNFNALYSLLLSNGVMNTSYQWIFGKNHLVIGGDVMDRGDNVTQVLWLLYDLERQARDHGGRVHFILGNHEVMNLEGNLSYVADKYLALAQKLSRLQDNKLAYENLLTHNDVMVDWMKQKNCIVKIGRSLFAHGGISPEILKNNITIDMMNSTLRKKLNEHSEDELTKLITESNGPLWYRGLVTSADDHARLGEDVIDAILKFYDVDRIVVGHTIVNQVTADYNGKVIRTDVVHGPRKYSPTSQALMIEGSSVYRINTRGERSPL